MLKRFSIVAAVAVLLAGAPAFASIQIDFSDDETSNDPGFRIGAGGLPALLEIGSNVAFGADGLDFLRITSVSDGSIDVLDFIIVLPELQFSALLSDGPAVDIYDIEIAGGGTGPVVDGFRIYAALDTGLLLPLLQADFEVLDDAVVVGSSGLIESAPDIGLTNCETLNGGGAIATLANFCDGATIGADFVAGIFSGGTDISSAIMSGDSVEGSSAGSIEAVPEPGTILLLVTGTLMAVRSRRRS